MIDSGSKTYMMRPLTWILNKQQFYLLIIHPGARAIGLLEAMSTDTFIKINRPRIQNIDGNLDEATITVLTPEGKLAFYWFEGGQVVRSKTQEPVRW